MQCLLMTSKSLISIRDAVGATKAILLIASGSKNLSLIFMIRNSPRYDFAPASTHSEIEKACGRVMDGILDFCRRKGIIL